MARMPGARWEPVTGHSGGPMRSYTGVVLHCNDANSTDLRNFIQASSGKTAVSCHFQVTADGTIYQYLDTSVQSWCQGGGNADYISVESEGKAEAPATPAQVRSIGKILAWCHKTHGIPPQLANRPGDAGLGWHGMGAEFHAVPDWGHSVCPGVRKDQRPAMIAAAGIKSIGSPVGDDVPTLIFDKASPEHAYVIFGDTAIAVTDHDTTVAVKAAPGVATIGFATVDFNRVISVLAKVGSNE